MHRAERSTATVRNAYRMGRRMAGRSAHVNDFLLGRDNGEGQLGEGHLRAAVRAFVEHHHAERPHQGLGNELIAPKTTSIGTGPVTGRARRLAQALRPRGRVTVRAAFSHTTGFR